MVASRMRRLATTPSSIAAIAGLAVIVLLMIAAPVLLESSANEISMRDASQGPSWAHLFGTDNVGRDTFARTLVATRTTVLGAISATAVGALCGLVLGAIAASLRPGVWRSIANRLIASSLAFPPIVVALMVGTVIGVGRAGAIVGVAIASIPQFTRFFETLLIAESQREYVDAARLLGHSRLRVTLQQVVPNIAPVVAVTIGASLASALIVVSSLSFLGIGTQLPDYDWGTLLREGLRFIHVQPWIAIGPAIAVTFAGVVFGYCGESIARASDPRLRHEAGRRRRTLSDAAGLADVPPRTSDEVVRVEGLSIRFAGDDRPAVDGVSFVIRRGEIVGLVGESGSGKTLSALAASDLLPPEATSTSGQIEIAGVSLGDLGGSSRARHLASNVGMVFQDPSTTFNPSRRLGSQIVEGARWFGTVSRARWRRRAQELLVDAAVPEPELRTRQFPHQLSGGLRQRAAIAMSLANDPGVLVADEPTTALDASVRSQILDLLAARRFDRGTAVLLISHDLATIASVCDRVIVMYAGRIVEELPTADLSTAVHPYTQALVRARLEVGSRGTRVAGIPGQPPSTRSPSPGCAYAPRCAEALDECQQVVPQRRPWVAGHDVACLARVAQTKGSDVGITARRGDDARVP